MFNIALYQPDIPQNTAAIIRLCACFDVTLEIIEPCGFHLDDKRLKRVAMDYMNKSKMVIYGSYENLIDALASRITYTPDVLAYSINFSTQHDSEFPVRTHASTNHI